MKFDNLFKIPRTFGPPHVPYRPKEIPGLFWSNFIYCVCSECKSLTGWHVELPDGDEVMICSTECLNAFLSMSGDQTLKTSRLDAG